MYKNLQFNTKIRNLYIDDVIAKFLANLLLLSFLAIFPDARAPVDNAVNDAGTPGGSGIACCWDYFLLYIFSITYMYVIYVDKLIYV